MKALYLLLVFWSSSAFSDEFPRSYVCWDHCSSPGLNQIMLSENGTFKVVASLTPERVTFSAGGYKVTGQRVHLTVEQKEVVFNIVKGEVLRSDTKMKAHKLIWVSGTTSYFKKGISFVETMPAVWGEPGL